MQWFWALLGLKVVWSFGYFFKIQKNKQNKKHQQQQKLWVVLRPESIIRSHMEVAFEPKLIRNMSWGAFLEKVRIRQASSCLPSPVCFSSNSFQFYPCEIAEKDIIPITDDYRMAFPLPRNFNWMKILSTMWHYKKWWLVLQMSWLLTLTHRGLCILVNLNLTRILSR